MIVPVMAISNLVLTQQIYSEETNGAHAHYREPVPLTDTCKERIPRDASGFSSVVFFHPLYSGRSHKMKARGQPL